MRVRLDVGQDTEVDAQAKSWWADPKGHDGTDLAVVTISEDATAGRECEPARFGRISDCAASLVVEAFGFPLFKLRATPGGADQGAVFRDFEQAGGHAPVAANRRQGTLAVYLDDPPPSQPPWGDPSPWEGMSGGPVWAAGRIVGVVAEHHPSEGTGRLTARRIDRLYEELSALDLGVLVELLGLAATASGLPDVVPVEQGQVVRSAYLAQVRDIAPDLLIGRESELAELAEFCAGADPYAWWQAGAWAGKSALASWFVIHPPAGADVVSFFITGRLYGQADSAAFLDAMIEQLNALYPAGGGSPAGARVGAWWDLLNWAAAQAGERARRLVVVVDGLDEDDAGATPSRGRPSIASLLPRRPPPNVRFIVTSRPDPGLPDDLPIGHPLRTCTLHPLPVSWVAEDLELRAKQELRDLLSGDQIAIDVVGYIAGAGGGLTRSDLSALTGAPPYELDPVLRGVFGRSLSTRASTDARDSQADPATRVYLFAHETLRVTAEVQLGSELVRYRQRVREWIDSYASVGWPDSTPGYAIRSYPGLLTATADVTQLSALARNPRRHAFLLRATASDYAALSEIGTVQSLIADQSVLDLQAVVELAAYRHAISIRNQSIPFDLPIVWARLARFDRAEALARTIPRPETQVRVLAGLVTVIARAGDPDRAYRLAAAAEALARTITDPGDQAGALTELVPAIARAGDPDRAEALARTITDPGDQGRVLIGLVPAIARAGDPDRAEALARTITDPGEQAWALTGLATAAAEAEDPDRAYRLAADAVALTQIIWEPAERARALTGLVTAIAQAGDPDRAYRLAADAEALARTITDPGTQAPALTRLAAAIAEAGDPDHAETLARTITDPGEQARALTGLVPAIAEAGDLDCAYRLAADAEALARTITDREAQVRALTGLVIAIAEAGDPDHAETLAHTITSLSGQAWVARVLAIAIARAGDPDRAEALARTITDPGAQAWALTELAPAIAQVGDLDCAYRLAADAEALARTITDREAQVRALTGLVAAIAQVGDLDRAYRLAADAEAFARTITDREAQAWALTGLATAAAEAGDPDRAYRLATDAVDLTQIIWDPEQRARRLTELVTAIAQAGDLDCAYRLAADVEALARTITDPSSQANALIKLVAAIPQAGDPDRAYRLAADVVALARRLGDGAVQAWTLTDLVTAIAQAAGPGGKIPLTAASPRRPVSGEGPSTRKITHWLKRRHIQRPGDPDRAYRLAADFEALARTITSPGAQAAALTELAPAIARAGDPDRAEALARTITDPRSQVRALTGLVTAAAEAGDPDRAYRLAADVEALARTIISPSYQAETLTELAAAIAQAGDPCRAGRLLARALVIDPGISWVDTVSRLFPSVISSAWDALVGAYTTRA